jgi:iron(II)-dependent oxidoreductase
MIIEAGMTPLAELADARRRTLALTEDLHDEQLRVPLLETINPFVWELGHIAYFAEFWTLRNLFGRDPIVANADLLYDSATVEHDDRWNLQLPSRVQTLAFMQRQFDELSANAGAAIATDAGRYFLQLILFHEDMHGEALVYTRQTLAYPAPALTADIPPPGGALPGDARIRGGRYTIGADPADGFAFDNEKWAHEVELGDFAIARAAVTNAQFAAFVEDGGYANRHFWADDGWAWRENARAEHPIYWEAANGGRGTAAFRRRQFDRLAVLRDHEPVSHVNYFEAQAYCAWAGRRLPTEAEWEVAATGSQRRRYPWGDEPPQAGHANLDGAIGTTCDVGAFETGESPTGCRQMLGNVWEWTQTTFEPYPGFTIDPYAEYSAPWFGSHKVLRGGAWSTRRRLITTRWRNFYRPHRRDIITGFRTVKI